MMDGYIPRGEPDDPGTRRQLWDTAIGLQSTDGLVVSHYLRDLADRNVGEDLTLSEVGVLLQEHYRERTSRTAEADIVSQRIVRVLEEGSFTYDPALVRVLHGRLFSGIDDKRLRPGEYRTENLVKTELVLSGDSVLYCDFALVQRQLAATFRKDGGYDYAIPMGGPMPEEDLAEVCWFMKNVWYAHPFWEGNARTVAVLVEL